MRQADKQFNAFPRVIIRDLKEARDAGSREEMRAKVNALLSGPQTPLEA